jgi:hypothetical protein
MAERNGIEAKDTKVTTSREEPSAHHSVGVGPRRDQRQKFGKMIAVIVNTMK